MLLVIVYVMMSGGDVRKFVWIFGWICVLKLWLFDSIVVVMMLFFVIVLFSFGVRLFVLLI